MNMPPEGLWRYPPTRALLATFIFVFAAMWALGDVISTGTAVGRAIIVGAIALTAAAINAIYVEIIISKERKALGRLKLQIEMEKRYPSLK